MGRELQIINLYLDLMRPSSIGLDRPRPLNYPRFGGKDGISC